MGESISISQEKKNVPLHERLIPSRSEENFAVNHLDDLKKIVSEESLDVLDWHQTVLLIVQAVKLTKVVNTVQILQKDNMHLHIKNLMKNKQDELEENKKKEKMRLEQELIDFKNRGGFTKVLHDLFYSPDQSSLEFDSVYKLKQLCMQYYDMKAKLAKELVESLDALQSDRPFCFSAKRKNFVIEDPNHPEGIKKKNFYYDIESMRINAEKDRIEKYKRVAQSQARKYYILCKKLSLANLEESVHAQYILDYMRNIIESGVQNFKIEYILDTFNSKELKNIEVRKVLDIVFTELGLQMKEFKEYLAHLYNDPKLKRRYNAFKTYFEEYLGLLNY